MKIRWLLPALVIVSASGVSGENVPESEEFLDYLAGTNFPSGLHFTIPLPAEYRLDLRQNIYEYNGNYQGVSRYKGDRRYDAFDSSYSVAIRIVDRSNIIVDWHCAQRNAESNSWSDEAPQMNVQGARYGSRMVWGDMFFVSAEGIQRITRPFVGVFVETAKEHTRGLLLFGRYEGPVFLPRIFD